MPTTVVLIIDGLPAHLPGPYGNTTVETPALNRLAAESMLFDFCFAESPQLESSYPLLLNEIVQEGSVFVADCPNALEIASQHPFDSIVDASSADCQQLAADISQTQAASFFAQAIEIIQTMEVNGLCWLHHRGLCGQWDAPWETRASFMAEDDPEPPREIERPVGTYDSTSDDPDVLLGYQQSAYAQVVAIDQLLGVFLDHMQQTGILDKISFVFGATRGYALGEHGIVGSFDNLYNEILHVPLMIRPWQSTDTRFGSRYQQRIQFRDLNRMIGELVSGDELSLNGHKKESISFVGHLRSLHNDQWKLICNEQDDAFGELFAKPDDRWDVNDVSRRCADVVDQLKSKMIGVD